MELKKGYKQTELGEMPEDWRYAKIAAEIDLLTGFPFPSNKYSKSGVRLIRGSNVKRGNTDWSDDITQYWASITPDLKEYLLVEGDIVIAMDGSLVGRSFARLSKKDIPSLLLQRVARIRSNKIDLGYLKEFICSAYFTKHCDSVKTASAIPHISPDDIRNFRIAIPPTINEQTAIANALSDMDALISCLEQLIEKKKAIKQGAMQQLLKPKDGWVTKKLGDYGRTYGGLTGKSKPDFSDGNCSYIPFMNIMSNPIIDTQYFDRVKIFAGEKQNSTKKGDLFFNGSSETPEEVGMCSVLSEEIPNLYLNSFCFGFRFHENVEVDGLFLAYYFRSTFGRKLIFSLAQGATRYNLSKTNLLKLELPLPGIEDQNEIARVVFDMDCEINSLKLKLKKTIQEKLAMMQVLLTGKIRMI